MTDFVQGVQGCRETLNELKAACVLDLSGVCRVCRVPRTCT